MDGASDRCPFNVFRFKVQPSFAKMNYKIQWFGSFKC